MFLKRLTRRCQWRRPGAGMKAMNNSKSAMDRAAAYIAKMPAAIAGQGGHNATFAAAATLVRFGLSQSEAWTLLLDFNRRCLPPWSESELRHKLTGAFVIVRPDVRFTEQARRLQPTPRPIGEIQFDSAKLANLAAQGPKPSNWRHWLWERSPKRPPAMNAFAFLKYAFRPGEIVLLFDEFESRTPRWTVRISDPMDCTLPAGLREGGKGEGIWFLAAPVDGQFHPNPRSSGRLSCRSEESVTDWRHAVLESDQAPAETWLPAIVQLPLKIVAIYTSGSRSIHVLINVGARTKEEWDACIKPLKRPLAVLGCDPGALSAVRLTRLPGCRRPRKNGFQQLLYLNPEPAETLLADLPALFSRAECLERWRNREEAFA